jgi:hypothetical protein
MTSKLIIGTGNNLNFHQESHLWANDNALIQKMLFMISPHGKSYETPFPAFLSYQLKSLQHLNFFDVVLLRDGALPLVKFFLSHRTPNSISSRLLIHEDLAYLVPIGWKEQVYYFRSYQDNPSRSSDTLFLYGSLDRYASPLNFIEKNLSMVELGQYKDYYLLPSIAQVDSEEKLHGLDHYYFKIITKITQKFPNLEAKNWNDLKQFEFSKLHLHPISDTRFWIADSYVEHIALSQGAQLAIVKKPQYEIIERVKLSPYHGLELHQGQSDKDSQLAQQLYDWYDRYESVVFNTKSSFPSIIEDDESSSFCSEELLSFVLSATQRKHEQS